MGLIFLSSALIALSSTIFAAPAMETHASEDATFKSSIREKLDRTPAGWIKDESINVDKNSMMSLRIHLAHQNMDQFHDLAMNIATPGHELYGAHLSQEVINSMIAPKDESRDLVLQWLDSEGLADHVTSSARSDTVILQASVDQIEKLLNADYEAFVRVDSRQSVLRTLEYSIPNILEDHVDMVQPTTFFGLKPQKSGLRASLPSPGSQADLRVAEASEPVPGCSVDPNPVSGGATLITPACLSNLYNYNSSVSTKKYTAGLMAIAGFLQEYPSPNDTATFLKYYSPSNLGQTYTCLELNGTNYGTEPCGVSGIGLDGKGKAANNIDYTEANLDVQYARAITQYIPNIYYSTYGSPPWLGTGENTNEPYLDFLNYLLGLNNSALPNTISISYGDDEATVPLDYATHVCNLFSQLGARGVSVLVASGDDGVGGASCLAGSQKFTTSFPAGCPWVTTVGGTRNVPEEGWSGSGGGFSEVFGRPSYQNNTITKWLTTSDAKANSRSFNSSGRAYPDIAAQAFNFAVVQYIPTTNLSRGGLIQGVSGTSCASPTFASIIQLLNSDRIASGKTGLGFLNPWLYINATTGLKDITIGSNSGTCGAGFKAVVGWDPVTGLGTPDFVALSKISSAT